MSERAPCTCGECPTHGDEAPAPDGRTPISTARKAARSRFQEWFGGYLDAAHRRGAHLVPSFALHWGVTRQTVERWGNVKHTGSPLAAGDLEALPAADLLALLEAWAEDVRGRLDPAAPVADARLLVLAQSRHVGRLAGQVEEAVLPRSPGGTAITAAEWDRILDRLAEQLQTINAQIRAARAARERA